MNRKEYYANLIQANNYLQHHGVKGQKWGVENGPPYPLGQEGKAALAKQRKADRNENKEKNKRSEKECRQNYEGIKKEIESINDGKYGDDVIENRIKRGENIQKFLKTLGPIRKDRNTILNEYDAGQISDSEMYERTEKYVKEYRKAIEDYLGPYKDMKIMDNRPRIIGYKNGKYNVSNKPVEMLAKNALKEIVQISDTQEIGEDSHPLAWLIEH